MAQKLLIAVLILMLGLVGCSKSDDTKPGNNSNGGLNNNPNEAKGTDSKPKNENCNPISILADGTTGGCRIRLVTPSFCELVDVSSGKNYEIAWTTDGTTCETPWKIILAGNPASEKNSYETTISTNGGTITQKGGVIRINASAFEGLTSDNGHYHWVVKNFYGSHPASVNFVVKK